MPENLNLRDNRAHSEKLSDSPLDERIETLARLFHSEGDLVEFPYFLDEILDDCNFDNVLLNNFAVFQEQFPEFDSFGFKRQLLLEASVYTIVAADDDEDEVSCRYTDYNLVAVPVSGRYADLKALVEDQATFATFADSFKACGFAAKESNILVFPFFLDMIEASNLLPGQVRVILKKTADRMKARDIVGLADEVRSMLNLGDHEHEDDVQVEVVILLVHAVDHNGDGELSGQDALYDIKLDNILSNEETAALFDGWMKKLAGILDGRPMFLPPSSLPRACSVLAYSHLTLALTFDAQRRCLPADDILENLTMEFANDWLHFSSKVGGTKLTTVSLPASIAMSDTAWMEEMLGIYDQG